jgi:hypothetical protein
MIINLCVKLFAPFREKMLALKVLFTRGMHLPRRIPNCRDLKKIA